MPVINIAKNRDREEFSFANINLLGKCNVRCYFCLGRDIEDRLSKHDQTQVHFLQWKSFENFLVDCRARKIEKIYITGQNTDSLLYFHLGELVDFLHASGFKVGLRTNGYRARHMMEVINRCELSTGYSIHSLDPVTNNMILGRSDLPEWDMLIPATKRPRISIVLNRCNRHEFFPLLRYFSKFRNIRYVQVRRISTDTRVQQLTPDMIAYEEVYTQVRDIFPIVKTLWDDADVFDIYGQEVVFWRTIRTSVNSINYFTDGTISDSYFVVEGYLKNCPKEDSHVSP